MQVPNRNLMIIYGISDYIGGGEIEAEIMMAGLGGQGVQISTVLLATSAMMEGKQVMHFGAYGGAMRGGPSECTIIIGDGRLLQPPLVTQWSALMAMGFTSPEVEEEQSNEENKTETGFEKYGNRVKPGGLLLINRSVIKADIDRQDVAVLEIPATELAEELGNRMLVSVITLGAFAEATGLVTIKTLQSTLKEVLPPHHHGHVPLNEKALDRGADFVKKLRSSSEWKPGALFADVTG